MKPLALIISVIIIGAGSGIAGSVGYVALSSYVNHSGTVNIDNFTISQDLIEQSAFSPVTFNLLATSSGDGGYQVYLENSTLNLTISSGSFYKVLNYTDVSLGSMLLFGSLNPGTYTIGASVFLGNDMVVHDRRLTVLAPVNISAIGGPTNVSDKNGAVTVSYTFTNITGGQEPFYYNWTVTTNYYGNIQNYSETDSNHSGIFTLLFYKNPVNSFSFGENATYYISLTVTDSLGYSDSVPYPGLEVNVTGN